MAGRIWPGTKDLVPLFDLKVPLFENSLQKIVAQLQLLMIMCCFSICIVFGISIGVGIQTDRQTDSTPLQLFQKKNRFLHGLLGGIVTMQIFNIFFFQLVLFVLLRRFYWAELVEHDEVAEGRQADRHIPPSFCPP